MLFLGILSNLESFSFMRIRRNVTKLVWTAVKSLLNLAIY